MSTASAPKTRDRILDAALRLYNEAGSSAVSIHRLAAEVGISPGNLYYHFKSRELIVDALTRRLERCAEPIVSSLPAVRSIDDVWLALHLLIETIHAHRFVFREVDYLAHECPRARERLRAFTGRLLIATEGMCTNLGKARVLNLAPAEAHTIAFQFVFTAVCGFMFARMLPDSADAAAADPGRAAYQVLSLLTPHLDADSRHYVLYLRAKYR